MCADDARENRSEKFSATSRIAYSLPSASRSFLFQSAPRDCSRGDATFLVCVALQHGFNPRPAIARGAIGVDALGADGLHVSIRAPRLLAGRWMKTDRACEFAGFQSAPRDCSRGDTFDPLAYTPPPEFQSAPRDCSRGDTP